MLLLRPYTHARLQQPCQQLQELMFEPTGCSSTPPWRRLRQQLQPAALAPAAAEGRALGRSWSVASNRAAWADTTCLSDFSLQEGDLPESVPEDAQLLAPATAAAVLCSDSMGGFHYTGDACVYCSSRLSAVLSLQGPLGSQPSLQGFWRLTAVALCAGRPLQLEHILKDPSVLLLAVRSSSSPRMVANLQLLLTTAAL